MKIILTIGDCNGIGIEVMLKALEWIFDEHESDDIEFAISGRKDVIVNYADAIKYPLATYDDGIILQNRKIGVVECPTFSEISFGNVSRDAGKLAAEAIETAASLASKSKYDALVTMPVSKFSLYLAGWTFPGQTEMLAHHCNSKESLMVLATDDVRVALVTIHEPLSAVSGLIDKKMIITKANLFFNSLKFDFGISEPIVAVLGLNPHAGESGSFGDEENEMIIPAIAELSRPGFTAVGPFAADGFFAHESYKNFDGILAMYHDQGLIPLKILAQGGGVNFTAGLNIVRTSPDHGTAFTIAGKNIANPQSSYEAIIQAIDIASRRSKFLHK